MTGANCMQEYVSTNKNLDFAKLVILILLVILKFLMSMETISDIKDDCCPVGESNTLQ
jgi:hypothetical protein